MSTAFRNIEDETTTYLSREVFDRFAAALEEPIPKETQKLLDQKPVWVE